MKSVVSTTISVPPPAARTRAMDASTVVPRLKCDGTPRHACTTISATSATLAAAKAPSVHCRTRDRAGPWAAEHTLHEQVGQGNGDQDGSDSVARWASATFMTSPQARARRRSRCRRLPTGGSRRGRGHRRQGGGDQPQQPAEPPGRQQDEQVGVSSENTLSMAWPTTTQGQLARWTDGPRVRPRPARRRRRSAAKASAGTGV
jgi:hypothetical protein